MNNNVHVKTQEQEQEVHLGMKDTLQDRLTHN